MKVNAFRLLRFFGRDWFMITVAVVLLLLNTAACLLKPWPLALMVDCLLGTRPIPPALTSVLNSLGKDWDKAALVVFFGSLILILHGVQALLATGQNYLIIRVGLKGLARVRNTVFRWLHRLSLRYYQGSRQGDIIYRASWDTYAFQTLFQHGWFAFLSASLSLLLMAKIMWNMNHLLAFTALGTVPILLLIMEFFGRQMSRHSLAAHRADSHVTSHLQQAITAMTLTQSYTREEDEQQAFRGDVDRSYKRRLSQHGWEVMYLAVVAIIFGAGIGGISWLGVQEVWAGHLTVGELLIFLAYLGQFYEPLNQLSHIRSTMADANAGVDRVFEILDTPEEIKDAPNARAVVRSTQTEAPTALQVQGAIDFEKVGFAYEPAHQVLKDITFRVAPGESVAIIGPSGAGKTTLIHLLPRFFDPTEGVVKLDGEDLRALRVHDLRSQISLVMQEPLLLPASISENIAYGKPEATPQEVMLAAQAAHADEFIQKLSGHYGTMVGEGSSRLSAGEKQRLNLARAFLKNAPILVLDEPTSALDPESEALVVDSLNTLMKGRTTFIVAHRLSTVRGVSKVMVLDTGRIAEFGTPEELLQSGGYFSRVMSMK